MFRYILNKIFLSVIICLTSFVLYAQEKQIQAIRTSSPLKIDGILDEEVWNNVPVATDFFQFEPYNGKPASQKTEVKLIYDDNALYIGAMLYDAAPDSILTELSKRDNDDINADMFSMDICPFNDGLNGLEFKVTASGVQIDAKYSANYHDASWNAVWESKISINDKGWSIEMKIPYSAIRFPKKDKQIWNVNFWRQIRRYREWSTWNLIDRKQDGILNQSGKITGIFNIKPPLRLSFTPYLSAYLDKNPDNKNCTYPYNAGMDIKYGINESFTIDMTLIPDFGQVQSDDKILNLSPFEIYYTEKRQFFTEGTELFTKADIFYSRRIGSTPLGYDNISDSLKTGEEFIENPGETQLINATKISGRNKKGLGIGVFNAMTANTYATIADSNGIKRKFITQPFTNYNMIAFDQNLKNNSYISIVNTNVSREKYSANVSGTEFKIANNKKSYAIEGTGVVSQKYYNNKNPDFGYMYKLELEKISGNFLVEFSQKVLSDTYNPNDLGYLQRNNEFKNKLELNYNTYKPFWKLLNWFNEMEIEHSCLYSPRKFTGISINTNSHTTFKNYLSAGFNGDINPLGYNDYFEARVPGRVFVIPGFFEVNFWLSSDYRKKLAVDCSSGTWQSSKKSQKAYWYELSPRFRANNKMLFIYNFNKSINKNDIGYVDNNAGTIYFGKRDIVTITNTLTTSYIFNNKSSLNFRLRHYWSKVDYNSFYILNNDGSLDNTNYSAHQNINFNTFNIDLSYTWNFAPGSEISLVWKNAIYKEENKLISRYFENFNNTINSPQINSFSVKILYYLDYWYFKKKI